MVKIIRPGKYIREISKSIKTIEGITTNTTAFIGVSEKGPQDYAMPISSFAEFQANYGSFLKGNWLAYAVQQFFNNGGTRLYIARVSCTDKRSPTESDYQSAFSLLDSIKDINLIAVPGIGSPSIFSFGSNYCEKRGDSFFLGEMKESDTSLVKAQSFFNRVAVKNSFGAVFFPWIKIKDPANFSPNPIAVPPSASVAGVIARTDIARGVWKSPAGPESNIVDAVGLVANVSGQEQNSFNNMGINTIRSFPGRGIFIWGARTLGTSSSSEYKYISVRRLSIFIEQSIQQGTQWVVFEANEKPLWENIRTVVSNFMMGLFKAGALQGSKPDDAYFVKCGKDTTTQMEINQGILNITVGFSPLRPTEFSILKIIHRLNS